jgi:hypothetical protein
MLTVIWKILFSGLLAICLVMGISMSDQAIAYPYLTAPDYVGRKITIIPQFNAPIQIDYSVLTPGCNPNSVIQDGTRNIYVACNGDLGNGDFIGVYDFFNLLNEDTKNREVPFTKTIRSSEFNSIVALKFDDEFNLWVSSYNNDQIIRFPKASLDSSTPMPDRKLVHSPDKPAGITFDEKNGSLWVVGQYSNGIVLNIPKTELNKSSNIVDGITTIDAIPSYCLSNNADGCQQQTGLFDNPEGITMINNDIWVSNNGGNHPAASLFRLRPAQNQIDRFGNGVANPFSCPGGLASDGSKLWINEQSFSLTDTTCGASGADRSSSTGSVFSYDVSALDNGTAFNTTPSGIQNITSRPGFGGIAVFEVPSDRETGKPRGSFMSSPSRSRWLRIQRGNYQSSNRPN